MKLIDDLAPFESPKLLIECAPENIDRLDKYCHEYFSGSPYEVVEKIDHMTKAKTCCFRFQKKLPSKIRTVSHSILNDLRHALDQAVCESVIVLGNKNAKETYFPFARDISDLPERMNKACKKVHPEIQEYLKNLRPYNDGDAILWSLSRHSGPNKHQRIIQIGITKGLEGYEIVDSRYTFIINPRWLDETNELEFAKIGYGGHLKFNYKFVFGIVFGDIEVIGGDCVLDTFRTYFSKVQEIVSEIELKTMRILEIEQG